MSSNFLTLKQMSHALGITTQGVRVALAKQGIVPQERIGVNLLFAPDTLERLRNRPRPGKPSRKRGGS